jgi:hypothetical protein
MSVSISLTTKFTPVNPAEDEDEELQEEDNEEEGAGGEGSEIPMPYAVRSMGPPIEGLGSINWIASVRSSP